MNPRISVIMGIYNFNRPKLLNQAIRSILEQTFSDFELIICDDGSTDGTWELLNQVAVTDERIVLLRNPVNKGLGYSLNQCLRFAKGEYIARMDADDISLPLRLARQIDFLEKHQEYALVGSWAELFENESVWGIRKYPEKPGKKDLLFGPPFIHPTVLMRADVLKKLNGYRVCKETLRAEDYDLWMRMYAKGYKGYNLQEVLYRYYEGRESYKRRSYKFRFDEAKVRYEGFKRVGLLPYGWLYVIKPLIVGLIPQRLLRYLRREKLD